MKNQLLFLSLLLFGFSKLHAQRTENNLDAQQTLSKTDKHFFIENKGQWPSEVLYLAQLGGLNTWITKKGMLFEFYKTEEINPSEIDENTSPLVDKFEQKDYKQWGHRVAYSLIGNNAEVKTQGKQKLSGYYNYLIGNDASKHASYVGLFKEAVLNNVYDGIDMRYYFDEGSLRYDYIVHPGVDPSQIKFNLEGSDKNYLNENGELAFTTCFGEVKNVELYCYQRQDKIQVSAKFIESANSFSFALGTYNKNETLIIDPLIYSTFIGGHDRDFGYSIAIDTVGNAYITGNTFSSTYDLTTGTFQNTIGGFFDTFISKLNVDGTSIIYSTFIGGNNFDESKSIAIDISGNAFITGNTMSSNFPVSPGSFQAIEGGAGDCFATKLNASGTALLYSTYIGGNYSDHSNSIAVDEFGCAYITGSTWFANPTILNNFPTTPGAYQTTGIYSEAFVTKINQTGDNLIYSSLLGGGEEDIGISILIDAFNNAYISGITSSTDFDTTSGAFQTSIGGDLDAFIAKLNISGSSLIFSTYIGGGNEDYGVSIEIDVSGNTYMTGSTQSFDFPSTSGAFQTSLAGLYDAFITKLNSTGSALIYSTFLGGSNDESGQAIVIDDLENAYITGWTNSTDLAISPGAIQANFNGNKDVFASKMNPSGNNLTYSTYLGKSSEEIGYSIALDASDYVFITGYTGSANFNTSSGAYQTTHGGMSDVFVIKLDMSGPVSLEEYATNNFFSISPNPSEGIYQITFEKGISCDRFIELYDMQGRLILNESIGAENTQQLNFANQPNGMYVLKVKVGNSLEVAKLVKL